MLEKNPLYLFNVQTKPTLLLLLLDLAKNGNLMKSKHLGRMYQFHLWFQQEIMETFPSGVVKTFSV